MFKEFLIRTFKPVGSFEDGACIYFIQKESIRYQKAIDVFIDFDIEFDGVKFVKFDGQLSWKGASGASICNEKVQEIRKRMADFFNKRGVKIQIR